MYVQNMIFLPLAIVRGLIYAKQVGADMINFSYGERVFVANSGRVATLITEFVCRTESFP